MHNRDSLSPLHPQFSQPPVHQMSVGKNDLNKMNASEINTGMIITMKYPFTCIRHPKRSQSKLYDVKWQNEFIVRPCAAQIEPAN